MGLEKLFYDLSHEIMVLDFFAGNGSGMTKYLTWFDDVTYWEVDSKKATSLSEKYPEANVVIGDSYEMADEEECEYNLILMENDIGMPLDHCENFDALSCISRLLSAEGGHVVSHICTSPKLYVLGELIKGRLTQTNFKDWMYCREIFFGNNIASKEKMNEVYGLCFEQFGLKLEKTKFMRERLGVQAVRWKLSWI
jgi:hypothetical protein